MRLHGRYCVLVHQLDLPSSLKEQGKLVETTDNPLKHYAIHQEDRHQFLLASGDLQKNVLQGRPSTIAPLPDA